MTIQNSKPLRPKNITPNTLFLGILALFAVGFVLKTAQSVVVPLLIAWLISYLLAPVVTFLVRRLRIPAPLAVGCVVLLFLLAAWGAGVVIQQRLLAFAKAFLYHFGKIIVKRAVAEHFF